MSGSDLLAVIDMQNIFATELSPWQSPRFAELIDPIRRLTSAFGRATVFTRFVAPEHPVGAWRDYYDLWSFARQSADSPAWDIVADLADPQTRIVTAATFSKWQGIAELLPPGGRLVLCGVSTECCVLSTALAAADTGTEVLVVQEACAGADDECHGKAIDLLALFSPLVHVVGIDDALSIAGSQ